jgi:outer membrane protein TolC
MKKSTLIPEITNITDLGYQGYSYTFNSDQRYFMNTVNLSWTLFNGFQNKSRIQQARIQNAGLLDKLSETERQIELQTQMAGEALVSAGAEEKANLTSLTSSTEYYKVISRQYAEGQKSLLELLDARNQLTNAQIRHDVSYFEWLICQAAYERATSSYPLGDNSENKNYTIQVHETDNNN